jgi:hypothetical protein
MRIAIIAHYLNLANYLSNTIYVDSILTVLANRKSALGPGCWKLETENKMPAG